MYRQGGSGPSHATISSLASLWLRLSSLQTRRALPEINIILKKRKKKEKDGSWRTQTLEIFIYVFIKFVLKWGEGSPLFFLPFPDTFPPHPPSPRLLKRSQLLPAESLLHHYRRSRSCPLQFRRRWGCSCAKCISSQLLFLMFFFFFIANLAPPPPNTPPWLVFTVSASPPSTHYYVTHTRHKLLLCNMTFSLISCWRWVQSLTFFFFFFCWH